MTDYLLDTNVISELRKGERADPSLLRWYEQLDDTSVFLSVLVVGELHRGVERIRRRDAAAARHLELWLDATVEGFGARILPVSESVARLWGQYGVPDPVPTVDGLLAATAQVHGLVLATRNARDVAGTGASVINPFGKT